MSGNPFRASLHQKQSPAAPAPSIGVVDSSDSNRAAERALDHDSDVGTAGPPTPQRTKKSVRIESPTSATTDPAAHDVEGSLLQRAERAYPASPSTINSPAGFSDNFEDQESAESLGRGAGGKEDAYETRTTPGSTRRTSPMIEALRSPTGVPANPFSRTLANIEPQEKGSGGQAHISDRASAEKTSAAATGPKTSLDVEAFKRLLMTGISSPSSPGSPPQATAAPPSIHASIFESSSSTDTSSISRQSLFEPVQEPHVETPRTSYEMAASDDETVGLMGSARKEKRKPPPPKHRHGKLMASRQPQVVSFSDFSASIPDASPVSRTRTHSDLNKPLPPPPVFSPAAEHIITQDRSRDELPRADPVADEPSEQPFDLGISLPPQKKVPPPVPLARRHSQLRTSNAASRSRSNSQLTMSSVHSAEFAILSPAMHSEPILSSPVQKGPPPPPPSRRHGAPLVGSNIPSANSSTTELPSSASSSRRLTSSSSNPPPSRRTTFSSQPDISTTSPNRASSVHSTRNNRAVSHESATMPPPPPPPRRRQSGRTSMEIERPHAAMNSSPPESRRTSLENKRTSIDSKRRTSVASESSLRHEYAPATELENPLYSPKEEMTEEPPGLEEVVHTESGSANILDDMEKFQREIDELRKRYGPAS
ncbi:hypothetical protein P154DRAFT_12536 [Amniculicola lignicola CBS 123094]|uniref:Uncharacterized protein n=1 Tax=Amniculicola lignicola CBS 123094 TaxID=1392246 RepID=A0A6A5X4Z1_9PLEO|nr:hypothetical protein P154DRAFT_12536 [Amniculicola lignicola CBS 123094]